MKYILFLILALVFMFSGFNSAIAGGSEVKALQMFGASIQDQVVYGYCVRSNEERFTLKQYVELGVVTIREENVYGSLKKIIAAQKRDLDWSECMQKAILFAKNTAEEGQTSAYYSHAYTAKDIEGYFIGGFCIHKPGVRDAMLRGADEGFLQAKDAPDRYRDFAKNAKKQLGSCKGTYLDIYIRDPDVRTTDSVVQK